MKMRKLYADILYTRSCLVLYLLDSIQQSAGAVEQLISREKSSDDQRLAPSHPKPVLTPKRAACVI